MTIRCDKSMRRSKERGYAEENKQWRCTNDCEHCICALFKKENGTWEHKSFGLSHMKGE